MSNVLRIDVGEEKTKVVYIDNGSKMFSFVSPIGYRVLRAERFSHSSANTWFSYIIWCLHSISYIDRIPTVWHLLCKENALWFSHIIENYHYTQFYTGGKKIHVILQKADSKYERHQKILSQFKI